MLNKVFFSPTVYHSISSFTVKGKYTFSLDINTDETTYDVYMLTNKLSRIVDVQSYISSPVM